MEDLEITQKTRLTELETVIERGQQTFVDVGMALTEIRESKLYRQDFSTFEDYCQTRWGWSSNRARYLISSAEAVATMQSVTIDTHSESIPLVQNEGQARELAKIKNPEIRAQVWQQVNEVAAEIETVVTAKLVKEAVEAQKQIELKESGRGVELPADFQTVSQALAENKQSAGYKWRESLYQTIKMLNSIRDLGGILALSAKWSREQRGYYAQRCREHAETLMEYAKQIEENL